MRYLVCVVCVLLVAPSFAAPNDLAKQVEESHIRANLLGKWPNADKAIQSKTDYWGDVAMRQPNGPSYDFFAKLLPPL